MPRLPPKETDVLKWLLEHGPHIAYQIAKESKVRLSTTYANLSRLERKGILESRQLKADNKTKGEREYGLTLYGLAVALYDYLVDPKTEEQRLPDKKTLDDLSRIASIWTGLLPDVFGKWEYFRSENVEHVAIGNLFRAVRAFLGQTEAMIETRPSWMPTGQLGFFGFFFYDVVYDSRERPYLDKWLSVLKRDPDMAKHIGTNRINAERERRRLDALSRALKV